VNGGDVVIAMMLYGIDKSQDVKDVKMD